MFCNPQFQDQRQRRRRYRLIVRRFPLADYRQLPFVASCHSSSFLIGTSIRCRVILIVVFRLGRSRATLTLTAAPATIAFSRRCSISESCFSGCLYSLRGPK